MALPEMEPNADGPEHEAGAADAASGREQAGAQGSPARPAVKRVSAQAAATRTNAVRRLPASGRGPRPAPKPAAPAAAEPPAPSRDEAAGDEWPASAEFAEAR